jgi:hypothetical protein
MHRLISIALVMCLAAACDEPNQAAGVEFRELPEAVKIHVEVESTMVAPPLFDCFTPGPDEQPAWIDYSDGNGLDEQKDIEVCVRASSTKPSGQCWREALLKLGGEVLP